jgi:hypothetical protein
MRKAFWARLLVLVMLLTVFPLATTAQAADPLPPKLGSLSFPQSVKAGSSVTFNVVVQADATIGLCCGGLTLTGPGGQELSTWLNRVGPSQLSATLNLSPNMPTGAWKVTNLWFSDNDDQTTRLTESSSFKHVLTVTQSDKPVDTKAPELVSIVAPAEAQVGDPVVIKANVSDDLSGVKSVIVKVAPDSEKPRWTHSVELFPTSKAGEFSGTMLMDVLTMGGVDTQEIISVSLKDQAGNGVVLESAALGKIKANKLKTKGKARKVPEGLLSSPYMNLIHGGDLAYWWWRTADTAYLEGLLAKSKTDPTEVRERIAAEMPQLRAAIDNLRKEIYVDPTTKLKVAGFVTTGKWMVLDRAILIRTELLTEMDRRAGRTHADRRELTPNVIRGLYTPVDEEELWLPVDGALAEGYSQLPAAVLSVLAKSPEAVKVLQAPAAESYDYGPVDEFDRDVLYFMPVITTSSTGATGVWGTNSFQFRISGNQLTNQIQDFFYQIGFHFGESYFGALTDRAVVFKWQPYLTLRGNQTWTFKEGFTGSPINNIGDDFAWSFLPYDLSQQYYGRQSYGRLRDNPTQAAAFKKLVTDAIAKTPAAFTVTPGGFTSVGVGPFQATVTAGGQGYRLEAEGRRWLPQGALQKAVSPSQSSGLMTFTSNETELGNVTWFFLDAKSSDGRPYQRYMYYYHAPVMLDPFPTATNQSVLKLSGTAPAGATVSAGGKSATADAKGRFNLTLPLTEGENKIRLTVSGVNLGATFTVKYEKSKDVPVTVTLPGTSVKTIVTGTVQTEPYAFVNYGSGTVQADSAGKVTIAKELKEGANKVEVTVTNTAGNKGSWSGVVMVDSQAPELTVSVPMQVNTPIYKITGKTEPGATLLMDGSILTVAADGSFSAEVILKAGVARTLEFMVSDAAGNRATTTAQIVYVKNTPAVTTAGKVTLSGGVEPGTRLTYDGKAVKVEANGAFSLEVPVGAGQNVYDLIATTKDGKAVGFLRFIVTNPLKVTAIAAEGDMVRISGKTMPGYLVMLDGETVTVDEDGDWTATIAPQGRTHVELVVEGGGQVYKDVVLLP